MGLRPFVPPLVRRALTAGLALAAGCGATVSFRIADKQEYLSSTDDPTRQPPLEIDGDSLEKADFLGEGDESLDSLCRQYGHGRAMAVIVEESFLFGPQLQVFCDR